MNITVHTNSMQLPPQNNRKLGIMILLDFPFSLEGAEKTGLKPLSSEDTEHPELAEYKNIKQNY